MAAWVKKLLSSWSAPHPLLADEESELEMEEAERRGDSGRSEVDEPAAMFWVDESGVDQFEAVRVVNRSMLGAAFRARRELPAGQQLWVDFQDRSSKAVVRHVRRYGDEFRIGVRLIPRERRREERQPVDGAGILEWNRAGQVHRCPVTVNNATQFGLQVAAKEPLPTEVAVRIIGDNMVCFGVTCYCTMSQGQYLVGVHLSRPPQRLGAGEIAG